MKRSLVATLTLSLASLVSVGAGTVYANTITYTFTQDDCGGGGCKPTSVDTVTLTDVGTTLNPAVQVVVNFGSTSNITGFVNSSGTGEFGFNLAGDPTLTSADITFSGTNQSDWALTAPPKKTTFDFDGLGAFDYSVNCEAVCTKGASNPVGGPLTFTIALPGISIASFDVLSVNPPGSSEVPFAADVLGNGNTGVIGATCVTTDSNACTLPLPNTIPEPSSLLLLGSGLVGAAAFVRRRRLV